MDGAKAGGEKAVLPLPAGSDAHAAQSSSSARQTPSSDAAAAAPADAPAAAGAGSGAGAGGEEDDDDEQVERFYALLANVRAMRGVYVAGGDADGGDDTAGGSGAKKRLRGAEPPWRPAFRLEDFEEPSPANKTKRRLEADDGESEARPAVAASSSPPRRAGVRSGSSSKNI